MHGAAVVQRERARGGQGPAGPLPSGGGRGPRGRDGGRWPALGVSSGDGRSGFKAGGEPAVPGLASPRLTVPRRPRPLTSPPGPCPRRPAAATEPEPPTPMAAVTSAPTVRGARRERTAGLGGGGGKARRERGGTCRACAVRAGPPGTRAHRWGCEEMAAGPLHVAPHGLPSCWCSWSHPGFFIRLMDFIFPLAITVLNLSETLPPLASLMLVSQGSQAHKWFWRGVGTKQGQIRMLSYNCWVLASAEAGF